MVNFFGPIFALIIILLAAEFAHRLKYPRIIGQLMGALIVSIPVVKLTLFDPTSLEVIKNLAQLGLIFLLLLTGYEIDTKMFRNTQKESAVIALTAAVVPFGLGFILGYLLGLDILPSLILGASMAVTAEGTKAALLIELNKIKSRIGSIMLESGIFDDVFEIFFLTAILMISHNSAGENLTYFPLKIILFIIFAWTTLRFLPILIRRLRTKGQLDRVSVFSLVIIIGLILAVISELAGLGAVIGALLAGIALHKVHFQDRQDNYIEESLNIMSFGFLIPFFFIYIGINFEWQTIIHHPWLVLLILLTATVGKILGTITAKLFVKLNLKQLYLIGWGMNSRGVMELIIASLAVSAGLISSDLYSAIVFMAVISTMIFPYVLRRQLIKHPDIFD